MSSTQNKLGRPENSKELQGAAVEQRLAEDGPVLSRFVRGARTRANPRPAAEGGRYRERRHPCESTGNSKLCVKFYQDNGDVLIGMGSLA